MPSICRQQQLHHAKVAGAMRMNEFSDGLQDRLGRFFEVMDRRQRRDNAVLGLSTTQVRILGLLLNDDGIPSGELADRIGLAPSTVTRVCDVLVKKDMVERVPADDDRRKVRLMLTPAGFRTARELDRWDAAAIDRIATGILAAQRDELLASLDLLLVALEADLPRDGEW
jgi:DNA-binding MarR family transcriptional regulator